MLHLVTMMGVAMAQVFYVLTFIFGLAGCWPLYMAAQAARWGDGAGVTLLYVQLGLSALLAGALFAGFGRLLELVEHIAKVGNTLLARPVPSVEAPLLLSEIAAPVRVLRSLGDMTGGLNERQAGPVLDFVGYANGFNLSDAQKVRVRYWMAALATPLDEDLARLRHLSPEMALRMRASMNSVVNNVPKRPGDEAAGERVKAAAQRIAELLPA